MLLLIWHQMPWNSFLRFIFVLLSLWSFQAFLCHARDYFHGDNFLITYKLNFPFWHQRQHVVHEIQIYRLIAKCHNMHFDGWSMQDGTKWPWNNTSNHPGMIQAYLADLCNALHILLILTVKNEVYFINGVDSQVLLSHGGPLDAEGRDLPQLAYVSREGAS